jgi:hypothetical protein
VVVGVVVFVASQSLKTNSGPASYPNSADSGRAANPKTFTNLTYGYMFLHPAELELRACGEYATDFEGEKIVVLKELGLNKDFCFSADGSSIEVVVSEGNSVSNGYANTSSEYFSQEVFTGPITIGGVLGTKYTVKIIKDEAGGHPNFLEGRIYHNNLTYRIKVAETITEYEEVFELIVSTFVFVTPQPSPHPLPQGGQQATNDIWNPVCESEGLEDFTIKVKAGDGATQIARQAIDSYLLALSLTSLPNPAPSISSEEKVYAEDYLRKTMSLSGYSPGDSVKMSCKVVEDSLLKARILTISQKQNLEEYSQNVSKFQILELIDEVIEENASNLNPIIISQ